MELHFAFAWLLWFAAIIRADPFHLSALETSGEVLYRVWYGDGQAYVGPTVPQGVKSAFNITSPGNRSDLLYFVVDEANSPAGTPPLPNPTFLVIDTASGAVSPVSFAHSAVNLPRTDVYLWASYDGILLPFTRSGLLEGGHAYLVPTTTSDTFSVYWVMSNGSATQVPDGARSVTLVTL